MNKKKIQALVIAGMISANTMTPLADTLVNTGDIAQVETKVSSYIKSEKGHLYLSDINYESESKAGWGEIKKDAAVESGAIKLIVDGELTEFGKGMAAHATSTLVYNISDYKDTYTRLMAYLGVDASRGSNGNGVYFVISTSQDGVTWNEVKRTKVLKGDMESEQIDIPLNGANYIKLHANSNGNNSADHSVYGDLKLVKENYSSSSTHIEGLETIESYDTALRAHDVDYNIQHNEMTILRRAFVSKIGYGTLKRLVNQDQKYADAVNYLLNDNTALKYYVMGGKINKNGSELRSLKAFCEIFKSYEHELKDRSENDFNLRLATSVSLGFAHEWLFRFWISSQTPTDPVRRYEEYQKLVASGKIDQGGNQNDFGKWSTQQFKELPVALMKWVVDNRINNDEILWLADYALSEKAAGREFLNAYNYIAYTGDYNYNRPELFDPANFDRFNEKYGNFNDYFDEGYKYGTPQVYRLWQIFKEGAVCGGLSKTYANLSEVFGRPASVTGQPGHAANFTWGWNRTNNRYEWMIQNDIYGWAKSGNEYEDRLLGWGNQSWCHWQSASYIVLATDCILDQDNYLKATLLNLLAESYTDNNQKKECYEKALEVQSKNLDSMEGLVNCYKADSTKTSADFLELAKKVINTYTYYPQAMMELLTVFEANVTEPADMALLDLLKNNALKVAKKATANESTNVQMTHQLAAKYLDEGEVVELASFSFDGDNAGKIVLNSKYEGSQIRVRYSLDGGTNWTESDNRIIELTPEELATITANNDIKVGLVGVEDIHTIDILEGRAISGSTIYANDNENLLIGNSADVLNNLEFSTDNGQTWCDYIGGLENGIRIEGDKTVKVRYKAYGTYLQSAEHEYTFTQDTDTEDRKYVQLKNVSLVDCSTPNSDTHKGEHLIDGSNTTGYHTRFGHREDNKFFTVKFDKERYITSLEYLFTGGNNGKLKSGEIYTSLDGQTWELSGTFSDLDRTETFKRLDLDKPTKCQYVKLVATETYGNGSSEANMYLAGRMLNFYEDTTIVEEPEIPEVSPEQPETPEEDSNTPDANPPSEPDVESPEETPETPDSPEIDAPPSNDELPELPDNSHPEVKPEETPGETIKPEIPPIEDIVPDTEGWIKTNTLAELDILWDYTRNEENKIIILDKFKGDSIQRNTDIKVEIPRSIEGYKISLSDLKTDMFPGVTHIRVAESDEEKVKVLATSLANGFKGNDTLKYVDFEGLDVSDVTDMSQLFSMCSNLRFINITDWVIRDDTNTIAMFYAKMDASDEEKKILVVANDDKTFNYDFNTSNRIPNSVIFSAEGGHFLGDENILYMEVQRFAIRPDFIENIDEILEEDFAFAGEPTREGYKFMGWSTDTPNPTSVYELINMTYKAIWEEVVTEEDTPVLPDVPEVEQPPVEEEKPPVEEQPPVEDGEDTPDEEVAEDIEVENKVDKTHVIKVNTKLGLDKLIEWLNSNMSYDREEDIIVDTENNVTIYKLNIFTHDKSVIYVDVKVSNDDKELIDILNNITAVQPPADNVPDTDIPPVEDEGDGDVVVPPVDKPEVPEKPETDVTPEQPPVEGDDTGKEEQPEQPGDDSADTPEEDSTVTGPETQNPQVPGSNTESNPNNNETVEGEINSSTNNISTGDASTIGRYLLLGATSLLGALGLAKKRNKK